MPTARPTTAERVLFHFEDKVGDGVAPPYRSTPNEWNGADLVAADATSIVRVTSEDPEAGVEVLVLSANGVLQYQAQFSGGTPVHAVRTFVASALKGTL